MAFNKIADNNLTYPLTLNTLRVDNTLSVNGTLQFSGSKIVQDTGGLVVQNPANQNLMRLTTATSYTDQVNAYFLQLGNFNTDRAVIQSNAGNFLSKLLLNSASVLVDNISFGSAPVTNSAFQVNVNTASQVGSVIRAAASQTADLFQLQDISGSNLLTMRPNSAGNWVNDVLVANGPVQISPTNGSATGYGLFVRSGGTASIGTLIRAVTSQTGDLIQMQSVGGGILSGFDANGNMYANGSYYGFTISNANLASDTYWKIATLPISNAGTYDHIVVDVVMDDSWDSVSKTMLKTVLGNRNSFSYKAQQTGDNRVNAKLLAYAEADGSVSVYMYSKAGSFNSFSYNISANLQATIYRNPTASTTAPTGTLYFDSSSQTYAKSILTAQDRSTLLTPMPSAKGLIVKQQSLSATVTNAVGTGTTVTYTTSGWHQFNTGQVVTITGVNPTAYNLTSVTIASVSSNTFTVTNAATGTFVSGGTATVAPIGNFREYQNSSGTILGSVNAYGAVGINGAATPNAYLTVFPSAATIGVTIKGAAGQTSNLQEWQDSNNNVLARIANSGQFLAPSIVANNFQITSAGVFSTGTASAIANTQAYILSTTATNTGLVVRGAASQTANLTEWQNSSGTTQAYVDANYNIRSVGAIALGNLSLGSGLITGQTTSTTQVGIVIKGISSQTADLQQWQDSTGSVVSAIGVSGVASGTTTTAASGIGFMGMPQNSKSASYTFTAADAGKHIYVTTTGQTLTIPDNGTVALPIGTTFVVVNAAAVTTSIAITTDTLLLAGSGTTGTRTLAPYGMATILKITSTSWIVSGNGIS